MNITEFMSFDLEWFTTLPGLLITGGVIVLLIALIIFIISNRKAEKKNEEEVQIDTVEQQNANVNADGNIEEQNVNVDASVNTMPPVVDNPQMQMGVMAPTIDVPVVPEVTNEHVNNDGTNQPVDITYNSNGSLNILGTPQVNGTAPKVSTAVEIPTFFEQNVPGQLNSVAPVNNNVMDFSNPATSVVQPVVPTTSDSVNSIPTVDTVVTNEPVVSTMVNPVQSEPVQPQETPVVPTPEVVQQPVVEPARPAIYGGVNPMNTVNATPVVESKPVIYGGANPLENTTTIPRITNHEAYNASGNNSYVAPSAPVEPVQPQVAPIQEPIAQEAVVSVPVAPVMEATPVQQPQVIPPMPMTGAEMFGTVDVTDNSSSSGASSEIETLEF